MSKVAILRGRNLNPVEMLCYAPLGIRHNLTAYSNRGWGGNPKEVPFPVKALWSPDDILGILPGNAQRLLRMFSETILGYTNHLWGLEHEIQLSRYDIVQTLDNFFYFSLQAVRSSRSCGSKVIVTQWDNIPFNRCVLPLAKRIKAEVNASAHAFMAVTECAASSLVLEGAPIDRIRVIPFGIDLNRFSPLVSREESRRLFALEPADTLVLFVGRLAYSKGIIPLLYAFKRLVDEPIKHVQLAIAGDGPLFAECRKLVAALGLQDCVRFLGRVPYEKIPILHSTADIFVLPSVPTRYWQEQFGMVLAEAMASEKAIIATSSGSIPEVVGDAALLVPPGDHFALWKALSTLVRDAELRSELGSRAKSRAVERYDHLKVAAQIDRLWQSV